MARDDTIITNTTPTSTNKIIPFNIPIRLSLEKHNYTSWCSFLKIHLGSLGLKTHIEGSSTNSNDLEWDKQDNIVKVWILGTLEESIQDQVVTTPGNAKAMWDHIKDLFHDNKDARAITLDGELRSIKLGSLTINAYCTKIKAMTYILANLGEKNLTCKKQLIRPTPMTAVARPPPSLWQPNQIRKEHELGDLGEPDNYKVALLDPESEKWLNAMNVKMQSMKDNEVWVLVELPPNGKTVGSKWHFKKKTDMDGNVHIYKARLMANEFTQTLRIDYEETFSLVADIRAIRILIAIAAYYDYEIWQIDVKTAFLNGYLNEEVYMMQPEGFVNPKYPNRVCKLKHSIYGLKQASRQWNKRFDDKIKKFGFTQNRDEPCVYIKASGSNITLIILYVDDILIMGNSIPMLQSVKTYLGKCFAMKDLGEAAYILGIKIYRDRSKRLIGLCQSAYIEKILKRYCMENSKRGNRICVVLNGGAVDWKSAKQSIFATSSAEAEYIVAFDASKKRYGLGNLFLGWVWFPQLKNT
nr:retrotransposon protein, putative, Ty1-copia subclass [Tanacetum cinerariifolium]